MFLTVFPLLMPLCNGYPGVKKSAIHKVLYVRFERTFCHANLISFQNGSSPLTSTDRRIPRLSAPRRILSCKTGHQIELDGFVSISMGNVIGGSAISAP